MTKVSIVVAGKRVDFATRQANGIAIWKTTVRRPVVFVEAEAEAEAEAVEEAEAAEAAEAAAVAVAVELAVVRKESNYTFFFLGLSS